MKKITLLLAVFAMAFKFAIAQQPFVNMAFVVFGDGKYYRGKILQETADMIRIQFLPSNNIYEFNSLGVITMSYGAYKVGGRTKLISVHEFVKDIYNEDNASYPFGFIGVRFGDGKLYFALSDDIQNNTIENAYFGHSGSSYNFIKENGVWKVSSTRGGGYPIGHIISQLYTLQNLGRIFYSDGTMNSPNFNERRPDGNN